MDGIPAYRGVVGSSVWPPPSASAYLAGTQWLITNIGSAGSIWMSDGTTRWYPLGGGVIAKSLGAAVTGIANSETIVLQTLLPVGAWQTNDLIVFDRLALTKSGTTDALSMVIRIGTAGTTSDTGVISLSGLVGATFLSGGYSFGIKLTAATTAQRVGTIAANNGSFIGGGTNAQPAGVTISSAAANALYVSFTIKSSSTNDTVGITSGNIKLEAA